MHLVRKQICITPEQNEFLFDEATEQGISEALIIRKLIKNFMEQRKREKERPW